MRSLGRCVSWRTLLVLLASGSLTACDGFIPGTGPLPSESLSPAAQATAYADSLQDVIRHADHDSLRGLIEDLRGNGGGNMRPMLAGVEAVLHTGVVGWFIVGTPVTVSVGATEVGRGHPGAPTVPPLTVNDRLFGQQTLLISGVSMGQPNAALEVAVSASVSAHFRLGR
jgi:hypothetical protein